MAGAPFQVFNAFAPSKGPMYYQDELAMQGANTPLAKNYTLEEMKTQIDSVQNIWVDNGLNPEILFLTFQVTQQILRIPRFSQGVYPVFAILPLAFVAQTAQPNITIPIGLLNMPMPIGSWAAV